MESLPETPVAVNRRRTSSAIYRAMDKASWPTTVPDLTAKEAVAATRLLYRRFYQRRWYEERGRAVPKKLTPVTVIPSTGGYKYTWRRDGGKIVVVWSRGWHGLVHDLSHYFHGKLRPKDKGHGDNHRALEREMIEHVVKSGWLDGKLVPKPRAPRPPKPAAPKPDPLQVELEKLVAREKAWKTRLRRAKTGLATVQKAKAKLKRKLAKQVRFSLTD